MISFGYNEKEKQAEVANIEKMKAEFLEKGGVVEVLGTTKSSDIYQTTTQKAAKAKKKGRGNSITLNPTCKW
jgi:hypothetical protein